MTLPDMLAVQADLSEFKRVSDWADSLANKYTLPHATSYALQLCLDEAVSNIVRHGFAADGQPDGDINLSFAFAGATAILTIEDGGMAFDPTQVATPRTPATISEARIGGLGIHLMRQFATGLSYERRDGRNRLTLRFEIPTSHT